MEHHSGDFQVVVRDIRQWSQQENDALTLIWLLEGSVELRDGETGRYLQADELAIVNRHRRWSLNSKTANVVMTLSLNAGWLTRLDGDFFSSAYQSSSETRDAEDTLRYLMRQLLVLGLVNPQAHYRLEANRWLSEIALLLASRFSRPLTAQAPRGSERWSQRINRVVARIDANYQRRLSLQEIAAAEFVSEAWLSRLFRKEVGVSFMQYITGLRLHKAAEQLTATRRSVQQIALQHGFASSRVMSDLFKREHGLTPRQFRQQHPQTAIESPRPRPQQAELWQPVSIDRLYSRLNAPQTNGLDSPPLRLNPQQTRHLDVRELPTRAAPLRHTRMVVTVRELDDLLREDVRRELEQLHGALPIFAIDIHDPFLSSRLFSAGWDDPQMAGYACWYNLQRIFSWLATMGWAVILHTGLTTRGDLLQRFLRLSANHFPPTTLASWRFVWHWSPQASDEARQHAWRQQKAILQRLSPQSALGIWHRFPQQVEDDPLLRSPLLAEADFLACQADANELLDLAQIDSQKLAASENYPVHKLRKLHNTLRQRHHLLPLWLLSWNTLTGDTRDTNGRFFRGALLMDNLLGLADQVWLAGFWLNSGLQGEARANGKLDTSSLALHYLHGLPRPVYWVLWLWRRLRGEVLINDKNLLLLRHHGHYQLLLRNTVVFNPWLSSEEAFTQRFSQPWSVRLLGLEGRWRIKHHLFDQHHGALFPLFEAFRSQSGPDDEDYRWLMHRARPALRVSEETPDSDRWQLVETLESNALALYEFTPLAD
ncbi:helix-turn-helix domain-containing protein [Klebsiella pasteurii]|uniref:helix-turn-helix domain-containing protein n=2 Tax=Klebsiella/Raoultella group TaxID=2890311 RepID=UPI00115B6536|nr:helix-turn-helix domain-containing protein [Klebsiella pasteurii]MDD9664890.1 helix-turn-helix domain-containing protein [Klebsiella pasteurii]MDD9670617.1 helix-turn-helix domain-containing protein [Klebsiella pasteurii]MDD9686469.1 helix-turn-helix domain-containing protein [Klebsiella pasteurii]VUS24625.1 Bifunctional transcriptional activator/DNA repair enzyme AdaA [Klebsiella pasteurii]VUS38113.1 Bifunctional transcriptional activator/DNA repair enzyme AdaA [Klebsiella pasteurii]